ncbi:MAG: pyridoxamine 5'-phosphate oxidase family protein [Oscillospiraceae bacterium]
MRRKDKEITNPEEILRIIDSCEVLHLAMVDGDTPYIVPMNFGYTWEDEKLTLYFHGANEGRKLEILQKNSKVSFVMDCEHRLVTGELPCQYSYEYASVMGEGRAEMVTDPQEKMNAMKIIMKHLSGRDFDFNERLISIVTLIRLPVDSYTGKRKKMPQI